MGQSSLECTVDQVHVEALLEFIQEQLTVMAQAVTSKDEKNFVKMLSDHIQQTSYKSLQTEQFLPRRNALKSAVNRGFQALPSHSTFVEQVDSLYEIKGISEDVVKRARYLDAPLHAIDSIIYLNCLYLFCNQQEMNSSALNVWIENLNLLNEWLLYIKDQHLKSEPLSNTPENLKIQAVVNLAIKDLQNDYQSFIQDVAVLLKRLKALQNRPLKLENLFEAEVAYRTLRVNFNSTRRSVDKLGEQHIHLLKFAEHIHSSVDQLVAKENLLRLRNQIVKIYGPLLLLPKVQEVFEQLFAFLWTPTAHLSERERAKYQQFIQELEVGAPPEEKEIALQPQPEEIQELTSKIEVIEIKEISPPLEEKPMRKKEKTRPTKGLEFLQKSEQAANEKQSELALEAIQKGTVNEPLLAELQDFHGGNVRFRTLLNKLEKLGIVADRMRGDHLQMVDKESGKFVTTLVAKNNPKLGTTKSALKNVEEFVSKRARQRSRLKKN